jgi:hypothetical protein
MTIASIACALLLLASASASAQEVPRTVEKPAAEVQQKPDDKTLEPRASQTPRLRRPRRAVAQVLTPTPRIEGSAGAPGYGPVLTTRPAPSLPPASGTVGTNPATCAGPNCLDSSGQRLGTGIGSTAITPQGRLCTKGLVGVQCF